MTLTRDLSLSYAAVLDDFVNQLFILGKVYPYQQGEYPKSWELANRQIEYVTRNQTTAEGMLKTMLASRADEIKEYEDVEELKELLLSIMRGTDQSLQQSPITPDNYAKIQHDRLHAENTLFKTQVDLVEGNKFFPLTDTVLDTKKDKNRKQKAIIEEEENRNKIKELHVEIAKVRKETEIVLLECDEAIAYLKDQVQEMKAKSNLEAKYVRNTAETNVDQTQRKCSSNEAKLHEMFADLDERRVVENRSYLKMMKYLKKHLEIMEEKVDYWMLKYENDNDAKQLALDTLKKNKADDLLRFHEVTRLYAEYEKLIVLDRLTKERARRLKERDEAEAFAAVMLQNWWRKELVVRKLGPFAPKKGKKA